MKSSLTNSIILITGAASGIGRSLAIQAAQLGGQVIATDVNEAGLTETDQLAGGGLIRHRLDVADAEAITAFAGRVIPTLAGRPLILVNNAGVALNSGPFSETSAEEFDWLLSINLFGVIRMTRAFLPYMLEQSRSGGGGSHLVNLSSVFGFAGIQGQSAYCTAKFGVRGFTETLRMELMGTGVSVSCVHPGGIDTNIARAARRGASGYVTDAMHAQTTTSFKQMARTSPDEAARQIWAGVQQGNTRIVIGPDGRLIDWLTRLLPKSYTRLFKRQLEKSFTL